jgi:hypothetical protein
MTLGLSAICGSIPPTRSAIYRATSEPRRARSLPDTGTYRRGGMEAGFLDTWAGPGGLPYASHAGSLAYARVYPC